MGLLGGSLAGLIITRQRKGLDPVRNMALGLGGTILGGLLFRLLGLLPGLDQISIYPIAPNRLGRNFVANRPGRV